MVNIGEPARVNSGKHRETQVNIGKYMYKQV